MRNLYGGKYAETALHADGVLILPQEDGKKVICGVVRVALEFRRQVIHQ
jgi:hypothetical protein